MIALKVKVNGQTIKIGYPNESGFLFGSVSAIIDNDDINNMKDTFWSAGKVDMKHLSINDEISFEIIELNEDQGPDPVAGGKAI